MSNELRVFDDPLFGQTRTLIEDGEIWFVGKDVLLALEYSKPNASQMFIDVPDEWKGIRPIDTPGGTQNLLCISEAGLYFFLGRSDKPKALPYQKKVAGEIIPSIREKGYYATKQLTMEDLCREYLATCEKQRQLEADMGKVSAEKQLAIAQRDEIGNNFGAGPEYYKVSEIPWLYAIFKRGFEKYLHKRIGQMLAGICKAQGTEPKKCQHENGGHWWRAYPKQVIELLHQQLLMDPDLLKNLRISKRKSVPQNKHKCLNFQ